MALLALLGDDMGEENIAIVVAELIDGEVAVVATDAAVVRDDGRDVLSFLAGAVFAGFADFLADGLAPSRDVRVGTWLGLHFPARNFRLCRHRPGLLL